MLKLFKFLFIIIILALLALAIFTLVSDITPRTETVTAPVEIGTDDTASTTEASAEDATE